jgi:hypothetical protein
MFARWQGGNPEVKSHHRYLVAIIQAALVIIAFPIARAEEPTTDGYVTRKEYEDLKAQLLAMKKELDALKKERGEVPKRETVESHAVAGVQKQVAPKVQATETQTGGDLHKEVTAGVVPSIAELEASLFGTTKFLLAGLAEAMYEQRNGQASTFSASFNPILLWELTPKILFDSRLEIEPSGGGTNVNLVNAQISYLLNDYVALGAGEFFSPSNVFVERFERSGSTNCRIGPLVFTMAFCQTYQSTPRYVVDSRSARRARITLSTFPRPYSEHP